MNYANMCGYGDCYDSKYEREMAEQDAVEARRENLMSWHLKDCRAIADKTAKWFYLEDLEAMPESMEQKQDAWEMNLQEEAELHADEDVAEAMAIFIEDGWEKFTDYSFVIAKAKEGGYFQGYPEITAIGS